MVNDENDKWTDDGDLPINPPNHEQLDESKLTNNIVSKKESLGHRYIDDKDTNILKDDSHDSPKYVTKEEKEQKGSSYLKELSRYIKSLDSNIKQLTIELKKFTDAKSWQAISQGVANIKKYANYYDVNNTIQTAASENPNDFDSPVYNTERVFEFLERYADIIEVVNDGTDTLFVIVSHGGTTNFSQEVPIFPGETKLYYNVYELRLRSPTAGLPYRVTEYDIENVSQTSIIPIEKASLHNVPLPVINTNWLSSNIVPTRTPTTFRIEVAVSISGNFSAAITNRGDTQVVTFNVVAGPTLTANGVYIFDLLVHSGDTVNFRYSTTGANIQILRVQEIDAAIA